MKKLFSLTILFFVFSFAFPAFSFAQGMPAPSEVEGMGNNMMSGNNAITQSNDGLPAEASAQAGHTAQGEAEGKVVWEKLQAQELTCENLSDDDFHSLGMHFMGVMVGDSHEVMDTMMEQMMGEEGEKQMHVAMGKRLSGCEPNAPMPQAMTDGGMMLMMMQMLAPYGTEGSRTGMMGGGNSMMGSWNQNPMWWGGVSSWLLSLLWLVWLIVGILAAIWLWKQITKK